MTTPELQLRTLYVLDDYGRLTSTREPGTHRPPAFALVRGPTSCAWAVRSDVPAYVAEELNGLAREELPAGDLSDPPLHADRYLSLLGGRIEAGPAFTFPDRVEPPDGVVCIEGAEPLKRHFGAVLAELDDRAPALAVLDDGHAVSLCLCARRSNEAAEAGLQTAERYRGRGFGPRVTAAWALAIRASGLIPLYSTAWTNGASRAVARELGLVAYAADWNVVD